MLKIFYLTSYLKQNYSNSIFCFKLWIYFLGPEEVRRLFANLHASPVLVVHFIPYFSWNSERIWRVMHFPVENMLKYLDLFCEWEICHNYVTVTPFHGSFKARDSTCSCFIMFACALMQSETWRQYSMSCWRVTRIW